MTESDTYVLGPSLLVAPVVEEGATSRRVLVPTGRFLPLDEGAPLEGPREVEMAAPVTEIPVLARAGAVIPLLSAEVETLLPAAAPTRDLASVEGTRVVLVFAGGEGRFVERDGTIYELSGGDGAARLRRPARRSPPARRGPRAGRGARDRRGAPVGERAGERPRPRRGGALVIRPRGRETSPPFAMRRRSASSRGRCTRRPPPARATRLTPALSSDTLGVMKEINAVQLRQSLSRLAAKLERDGEPIALTLGRRRVGVIISVRDFNERFALKAAAEERRKVVEEILADKRPGAVSIQRALDEIRGR